MLHPGRCCTCIELEGEGDGRQREREKGGERETLELEKMLSTTKHSKGFVLLPVHPIMAL